MTFIFQKISKPIQSFLMGFMLSSIMCSVSLLLLSMSLSSTMLEAQNTHEANQGFIYGKITTVDGDLYQGFLRWNREEVFWTDLFNATKIENENLKFRTSEEEVPQGEGTFASWTSYSWSFLSIWEDKCNCSYHKFAIMFGDIHRLDIISEDETLLTLKNGVILEMEDNSNDIGGRIYIEDDEIGEIKLNWERIKQIEFSAAPSNVQARGKALYGTVETTRKGSFTGFIQWDHDERISSDVLDGRSTDGDEEIPFGKISRIEKGSNGSWVNLWNGKEMFLKKSNDVDEDNKGIIVTVEGVGRVDIDWMEFKQVQFAEPAEQGSGASYHDFEAPVGLRATVKTITGEAYSGLIAYDIDELWETDMLDAEDDNIKYSIPFRNVHRVARKNRDFSIVELKNGMELLLGDTQDVSDDNDGLLIIQENRAEPIHLKWPTILEIVFY